MDEDLQNVLEQIDALIEQHQILQETNEKSTDQLNQQQREIFQLSEKLATASSDAETDWHRLSDTLQNTLTLVKDSTDHSGCEQKICTLTSENQRLANDLADLRTNHELKITEVEYKQEAKWKAAKSSLENQIEALKITKSLVRTDVHEKCAELEQKYERISAENRDKYDQMVLHYEKLLQIVRLENADLEKENVQLIRDKEHLKAEIHKSNLKLGHQMEQLQKARISEVPKIDAATETEHVGTNVGGDDEVTRKRKLYTKPRYEDEKDS